MAASVSSSQFKPINAPSSTMNAPSSTSKAPSSISKAPSSISTAPSSTAAPISINRFGVGQGWGKLALPGKTSKVRNIH